MSSPSDSTQPTFAWYGKLPGAGDFVSRRMAWRSQQLWDQWLASGLEQLKALTGEGGWTVWRSMPAWGFILPAGVTGESAQIGLIVPSADRVGRVFPFLVVLPMADASSTRHWLLHAGPIVLAWFDVISTALRERQAIDVVDARLDEALDAAKRLPAAELDPEVTLPPEVSNRVLPWPDLTETFDPLGRESYWWSVPPASTGFRARTYSGMLTAAHFCALSQ